jgi:hypothetical protein
VIHWNLGPKVACAPHSKTIAKRHIGLGFLFSQSLINLFFVTVHPALYEDLIPYVHVAHDLESLVRSTDDPISKTMTEGVKQQKRRYASYLLNRKDG